MAWATLGVKSGLAALLLLAFMDMGATQKIVSPKPEIGSKKILVVLPVGSRSHHNVFNALIDELVERGHHLTVITSLPRDIKHPRRRDIVVKDPFKEKLRTTPLNFFDKPMNFIGKTMMMYHMGLIFSDVVFNNLEVQELKKEKFDLVITEIFFFQETFLAFAHHFGCPSMTMNPFGYAFTMNDVTGGPINPSYVTNVFSSVESLDTFEERFYNSVTAIFSLLTYHLYYYRNMNAVMHKAFPDAPPLYDLLQNLSLTLINNNDALMYPVPLPSSVVQVGGIHIKPGKPLEGNLKQWIEESKDGIVYFSLGSNLRTELLPAEKRDTILASFAKLKQRVLLKWNGPLPANAPPNCRFEEWVPQQEVLAHPKTRVFVTHGGLLSTQETVYYGAPIVALPVFGDQQINARVAARKGIAVVVDIFDFTSEAFDAALAEVINNPKYREQVKKLKAYFRSDPIPPLEKAVYYTELLIKLGNFKHLQPISVNLSWYQYLLLDVAAVILGGLWLSWLVLRCIVRKCLGLCRKSKTKKD